MLFGRVERESFEMLKFLKKFLREEDGPTSVEYAVMLAMILMAVIVTITAFGQQQNQYWGGIKTELSNHGF